jgi:hypothetical protein
MARYSQILGLPFWVAVSFACAETSSPRPTIAGTWHVIVQRVDSGTLTPSIFTVVIRVATESTFTVTMPPLVWSEGPVRYDTIAQITRFQGDSPDSTLTFEEWCKSITCAVTFRAIMNQTRDTLPSGTLQFWDTVTVNGRLFVQTIRGGSGHFVAHK